MTTFHDIPAHKLARSKKLSELIKAEILQQNGCISFDTYMEFALYHPEYGYYFAEDFQLGEKGDFTTAPEISPLFAQCFARQVQEINQVIRGNILELGAGTGKFTHDILSALAQAHALPEYYFIYEISTTLRKKQQDFLQKNCPEFFSRIVWLNQLPQDFVGVIIANEVLDALPVHLFTVTEEGIKERLVSSENNEFVFTNELSKTPFLTTLATHIATEFHLPPGYNSELNLRLPSFMAALATSLKQGVLLIADYGYGQREYYHPSRKTGTLTCFYAHQKSTNPLVYPGLLDLTAHVDFTRTATYGIENNQNLSGFTPQFSFLLSLGLIEFAEKLETNLNDIERFKLHQAIKILTFPTEMGECVKIMALSKNCDLTLRGFHMQNRKRDL